MNSTRSPSLLDHLILYATAIVTTVGLVITLLTWRDGVHGLVQGDPIVYVGPPVVLLAATLHTG